MKRPDEARRPRDPGQGPEGAESDAARLGTGAGEQDSTICIRMLGRDDIAIYSLVDHAGLDALLDVVKAYGRCMECGDNSHDRVHRGWAVSLGRLGCRTIGVLCPTCAKRRRMEAQS